MKVLLIQPPGEMKISIGCKRNYSEARSPLPPLGLLYLAGHLKKNHEVKVLDMSITGNGLNEFYNFEPDIVGIPSVIGLWPTVVDILNLIKWISPSVYIVVGGSKRYSISRRNTES